MSSSFQFYSQLGLTNTHSEDYGVVAHSEPAAQYRAYCESQSCAPMGSRRVRKDVERDASLCPDCGRALFWKKASKP